MATTDIPFRWRATDGVMRASVVPNDDPVALGCDLLDATLPPDAAAGFPVCRASVVTDLDGYGACHGWVQLVRSSDSEGNPEAFEIDPTSLFRGVSTPYAFFGLTPELFDALFRESRYDMTWEAHSFMAFTPDGVMSRRVLAAAGFSWGFSVSGGAITLTDPAPLDGTAWDGHLALLRREFPEWAFEAGFHE